MADPLTARRPLMAGNWKMNLNHLEANLLVQKLAASLTEKQLDRRRGGGAAAVHRPAHACRRVVDGDKLLIGYGAQDLSPHQSGAYTGEISGAMLAKLGCPYVVVGHSERRQYHHEDDALVNAKVKAALANGLTPILCVGEGLDVREQGEHVAHCCDQLDGGAGRAHRRAGAQGRRRVRAGLGDRHRQDRHPGGRPGGLRRDPGAAGRDATTRRPPTRSGSSTAAR